MTTGRVLVAGEALVDLIPTDDRGAVVRAHPGGGPANTAVALARLEVPTCFVGRLGSGFAGMLARRRLEASGVDLALSVDAEQPTALATARLDAEGHAEYSFYVEGTADFAWTRGELPGDLPEGTVALHTGSLAALLQPGSDALLELAGRARAAGVAVSYDPNVRANLADRERYRDSIQAWAAASAIVKLSDDDVGYVWPDLGLADAARQLLGAGPSLVVVTRGAGGAIAAWRAGGTVRMAERPGVEVDVVDTVGAGDAFAAGLLDGLRRRRCLQGEELQPLDEADVAAAVDWATRVAATTCTRAGADPPYAADVSPDTG